jgi:hypothetical protein
MRTIRTFSFNSRKFSKYFTSQIKRFSTHSRTPCGMFNLNITEGCV